MAAQPEPASRRRRAPVAVIAALALLLGFRLWLVSRIETPWIMIDELLYASLAESLAEGRLGVRDEPLVTSLLYPLLIAPAWLAAELETTYALAKAINVVAMSSVAVPVFLWARSLGGDAAGLVAAGLTLLLSGLVFTTALMTENLFLPLFVAAAWALARALDAPSAGRWGLVLALVALVVGTRVHGLVLGPVLVLAVVLFAMLEARAGEGSARSELRRSLPWAGAPAAVAALALVVLWATGWGLYEDVLARGYDLGEVARWGVYNTAALVLAAGILPVLAFVVSVAGARTRAERALAATTVAAAVGLLLVAAGMSTLDPPGLRERYVFHAAPLFLVAFAVWLRRETPPRRLLAAAAAVVVVALVAALPLRTIFGSGSFLGDGFSLIAFWRLARVVPGDVETAKVLLVAGTAAACALFLLTPRRLAPAVLPAAVAVYLAASSAPVFTTARNQALGASLGSGQRAEPAWIDGAVGRDAEVVFLNVRPAHPPEWMPVWHAEFWNRSFRGVVNVAGVEEPSPLPQREARAAGGGRVSQLPAHVLVGEGVDVEGEEVARSGPLRLVRVGQAGRAAVRGG
jgi:hypothetical protein